MKRQVVNFLYDKIVDDKPIGKVKHREKVFYIKNSIYMGLTVSFIFILPILLLALLENLLA